MQNHRRIYSGLGPQPLYNLHTVNKNGFTPFANGRCQSLLQSIQEYNATFAELMYLIFISSINAFHENVLII